MTGQDEPADTTSPPTTAPLLFQTFDDLAAEVDAAGPRRWLVRGIWPAGDYGVLAAEKKAQKSWGANDLAVSVATGTPWLGAFAVDQPGPVLLFIGEGGKANVVRRVRAVAEAKGVDTNGLRLDVCARAPRLASSTHLSLIAAKVAEQRPVLVIVDPLYLAAGGANGASLYDMAPVLENVQHVCQAHGSALLLVHHYNRKTGSGADRISGAGPAEWGRVLISADVKARHTDPTTRATTVVTELDIIGGEVPDRAVRVTRRIWADDPDDINSVLHVCTTAQETDDPATDDVASARKRTPAETKILTALRDRKGEPATAAQLVDAIAEVHGHGLKRPTVSTALNNLERDGFAEHIDQGQFAARLWIAVDAEPASPRVSDAS